MMFVRKSIARLILVASVTGGHLMAQAPDATEDIRGPKPLVEIPQPEEFPVGFWAGVAGGILLGVLAICLWKWWARRKRRKSPPEIALASLGKLEATRDTLAAEAFADQAAGTIRQYIADRFGLAAPRRTTEEFLRELAKDGAEPVIAESDHLKSFLKSCDLAKFAGSQLDASQRGELLHAARGFVTATVNPNTKAAKP